MRHTCSHESARKIMIQYQRIINAWQRRHNRHDSCTWYATITPKATESYSIYKYFWYIKQIAVFAHIVCLPCFVLKGQIFLGLFSEGDLISEQSLNDIGSFKILERKKISQYEIQISIRYRVSNIIRF